MLSCSAKKRPFSPSTDSSIRPDYFHRISFWPSTFGFVLGCVSLRAVKRAKEA